MTPFFGIVVACCNSEQYIAKLVHSLRAQTFKDFDVCFVDDCSTDDTWSTILHTTTGWCAIKIFGSNNYINGNGGICKAFNSGAALLDSQYLWFIHGDTWLERDCLEKMHTHIQETGCRFLTARELRYDSQGDVHFGVLRHRASGFDVFGSPVEPTKCEKFLYAGNLNCFERGLFETIGRFDEWLIVTCDEPDNGWRVAIHGERAGCALGACIHHRIKMEKGLREFDTPRFYRYSVNQLYYILKNAQHFLLLMYPLYALLRLIESVALAVACRKPSIIYWLAIKPHITLLKDWTHIAYQRRVVKRFRRHGDFWFAWNFVKPFKFGHASFVRGFFNKLFA